MPSHAQRLETSGAPTNTTKLRDQWTPLVGPLMVHHQNVLAMRSAHENTAVEDWQSVIASTRQPSSQRTGRSRKADRHRSCLFQVTFTRYEQQLLIKQ